MVERTHRFTCLSVTETLTCWWQFDLTEVSSAGLRILWELSGMTLLLNVIRCVSTRYLGRKDFRKDSFC